MCLVDFGDASVYFCGVGEAAFEVGVYGGGGQLGAEGAGVLHFCAVGAGVVDELVDCGLGFVRVVAVVFLVHSLFLRE